VQSETTSVAAANVPAVLRDNLPSLPPAVPPDELPDVLSDDAGALLGDLAGWDCHALSELLKAVGDDIAALALASAPSAVAESILARCPVALARRLRRHIEHLGPTPLADMELAQRELVQLASDVAARGTTAGHVPAEVTA
jgi:hypothetical protein